MIWTYGGLKGVEFPQRLAYLRKQKRLTQQALSEAARVSLIQLRRYEGGSSQPTLDVIKRLAIALSVSSDALLFAKDERDPDEDLRMQFEAVSRFDPEDKRIAKVLLDSLILKHEAKRWATG